MKCISALMGDGPSNFCTHYRLTQGSLSHIPNWAGSPLQNFKGEDLKLGLKFSTK